jgi:ribose transport system permease protein
MSRAKFVAAAAFVAAILMMQNYTRIGRYILAIGGNIQAAIV